MSLPSPSPITSAHPSYSPLAFSSPAPTTSTGENPNCVDFRKATHQPCNTTGYYCGDVSATHNFTIGVSAVGKVSYTTKILCHNITNTELCPPGSYCPNPYELSICPSRFYCGQGFGQPRGCPLGGVPCLAEGTVTPSIGIMFGVFLAIVTGFVFGYRLLARRHIFKEELTFRIMGNQEDAVAHEEFEQAYALKYLNKLFSGKTAKPRALDRRSVRGSVRYSIRRSDVGGLDISSNPVKVSAKERLREIIRSEDFKNYVRHEKLLRDQFTYHVTGKFKFQDIANPLRISFENLNLKLKVNNATVLEGLFGVIRPYNVTALMGPSGAGKTTLLSLLRGQAHFATTSGTMAVNGQPVASLVPIRDQMSFVPQEDVMYDDLTVEDNIVYSAILFNKRGYSKPEEVLPMVTYAEELLGIEFIRNSIVGSAEKKGISGGQKKRTSIAMEMMKEAPLFFLDEPTSGLDSATSISVLNSLHRLSDQGVNIVATIHQPRQEIFDLIHTLLLLAPGGRIVYFGPAFDIRYHFSTLGYTAEISTNIADYVMDVLAGFIPEDDTTTPRPPKEVYKKLCDWWRDNKYPEHQKYMLDEAGDMERSRSNRYLMNVGVTSRVKADASTMHTASARSAHDAAFNKSMIARFAGSKKAQARNISASQNSNDAPNQSSFFDAISAALFAFRKVIFVAFDRQVKTYDRNLDTVISTSYILFFLGILIALLFGRLPLQLGTAVNLPAQVTSSQLTFCLLTQTSALKVFAADALVRTREETGGIQLLPLFLGKLVGSYVELMFFAFAYAAGYYSFVSSQATFAQYWFMFLALHFAITGMSNLIAVLFEGKNRALIASGSLVVLWSFGGVSPSNATIDARMGVFGYVLNGLSPFKWSFPLQFVLELQTYSPAWGSVVNGFYTKTGFDPARLYYDYGMLIVYWLITNCLAYLVLVCKRDNFKVIRDPRDSFLALIAPLLSSGSKTEQQDESSSPQWSGPATINPSATETTAGSKTAEKATVSTALPVVSETGDSGFASTETAPKTTFAEGVNPMIGLARLPGKVPSARYSEKYKNDEDFDSVL